MGNIGLGSSRANRVPSRGLLGLSIPDLVCDIHKLLGIELALPWDGVDKNTSHPAAVHPLAPIDPANGDATRVLPLQSPIHAPLPFGCLPRPGENRRDATGPMPAVRLPIRTYRLYGTANPRPE